MSLITTQFKRSRMYLWAPALALVGLWFWLQRTDAGASSERASAAKPETAKLSSAVKQPTRESSVRPPAHVASPTRADPPVTHAEVFQPEAPAIETPDVIASMDIEFVRDEVERMDRELERRKAIERLNNEQVSQSERLELGSLIQRAALFRHRLLEVAVESLTQEVAKYEGTHEARVAQYTKHLNVR